MQTQRAQPPQNPKATGIPATSLYSQGKGGPGRDGSHLSSLCGPIGSHCHPSSRSSPSARALWPQPSQGPTSWVTPRLPSALSGPLSPPPHRVAGIALRPTATAGCILSWLGLPLPHTSMTASPNKLGDPPEPQREAGLMPRPPSSPPADTCSATCRAGPIIDPFSQRRDRGP